MVSAEEIEEHAYAYTLPLLGRYFGTAGFAMDKVELRVAGCGSSCWRRWPAAYWRPGCPRAPPQPRSLRLAHALRCTESSTRHGKRVILLRYLRIGRANAKSGFTLGPEDARLLGRIEGCRGGPFAPLHTRSALLGMRMLSTLM